MTSGRVCPLHYRYSPRELATGPVLATEALYVVGGLYGNPEALDAVEALVADEPQARVVFNGDCHFFDRDRAVFDAIHQRVLAHDLTAGNVEAELADPASAGCGCAYPDYVSDAAVERSNTIVETLKGVCPPQRAAALAGCDYTRRVDVGGWRIGIVHGDPESLAGWGLAAESLPPRDQCLHEALGCDELSLTDPARLAHWFREANVDVFASTHTCLPVVTDVDLGDRCGAVINNGSAGMPNFRGTSYALATRIALSPHPRAVARLALDGLNLELMPLAYDQHAWWQRFTHWWAPASAAYLSYAERLCGAVNYHPEQAVRGRARWLGHP